MARCAAPGTLWRAALFLACIVANASASSNTYQVCYGAAERSPRAVLARDDSGSSAVAAASVYKIHKMTSLCAEGMLSSQCPPCGGSALLEVRALSSFSYVNACF
jgi:hypothetical protein